MRHLHYNTLSHDGTALARARHGHRAAGLLCLLLALVKCSGLCRRHDGRVWPIPRILASLCLDSGCTLASVTRRHGVIPRHFTSEKVTRRHWRHFFTSRCVFIRKGRTTVNFTSKHLFTTYRKGHSTHTDGGGNDASASFGVIFTAGGRATIRTNKRKTPSEISAVSQGLPTARRKDLSHTNFPQYTPNGRVRQCPLSAA